MRHAFLPALLLLTAPALPQGENEKIFHTQTSATTRDTTTGTDRLFFMQPQMARTGYGKAAGWRGVFQDENQSTAETIRVAFVKFAADNVRPDVTTSGRVVEATYRLFGTGSGSAAYLYTMTLATRAGLPNHVGILTTLPPTNGWPQDGVSVHYQNGTTTKVPAAVKKPQWTWVLKASAQSFAPPLSTLHLGGLYEEPVLRVFTSSTAYGARKNLFGPEALFPDPARGDRLGYAFTADTFKGKLAILVIAPSFATAVPTPFGTYLIQFGGSIFLPAQTLNAKGEALTPALVIPGALKLAAQSLFLDVTTLGLRLSDANAIAGQ